MSDDLSKRLGQTLTLAKFFSTSDLAERALQDRADATAEIARLQERVKALEGALGDACLAMSDLCNAPIGVVPKSADDFYDYNTGVFRAALEQEGVE